MQHLTSTTQRTLQYAILNRFILHWVTITTDRSMHSMHSTNALSIMLTSRARWVNFNIVHLPPTRGRDHEAVDPDRTHPMRCV
jgi:hypothetical protein